MKLRIRGDSIRLRLTRGDVDGLLATGVVEEVTRFPGGEAFRYRLLASAVEGAVGASFATGSIDVLVPVALARQWGESDEVGFRAEIPGAGHALSILVEKDFPCPTSRPGEDDSDAFARRSLRRDSERARGGYTSLDAGRCR